MLALELNLDFIKSFGIDLYVSPSGQQQLRSFGAVYRGENAGLPDGEAQTTKPLLQFRTELVAFRHVDIQGVNDLQEPVLLLRQGPRHGDVLLVRFADEAREDEDGHDGRLQEQQPQAARVAP